MDWCKITGIGFFRSQARYLLNVCKIMTFHVDVNYPRSVLFFHIFFATASMYLYTDINIFTHIGGDERVNYLPNFHGKKGPCREIFYLNFFPSKHPHDT
jgi:hypothetical protein